VIVTHDTREEALACLASAQRAGARELVLVDSGSTDGTAEAVRSALPDVGVLELVNVGFGRAANAGVARDQQRRSWWSPTPTCASSPTASAVLAGGAARRWARGGGPAGGLPRRQPQASARRLPDPGPRSATRCSRACSRATASRAATGRWTPIPTLPRDVDWLSGCALALRREAFEAVGGFDPGYFLYVEDVDLGVRLQAAGWRLRYTPSARVTHRVGASTGQRRARALIHHARGLDRFYDRHLARTPTARLLRPLVRLALAGWVVATLVWERVERWAGVSRSTTGERGGPV
jgi:N-acetylglucosaminyl-diphospho-decaprenol L-rhamnosyltransferase